MRRCLGFIAVLLTVSLLIPLSVSATDYVPQTYTYNLYANGENYGGYLDGVSVSGASGSSQSGTFTVPLTLDTRFKSLLLGAVYMSNLGYDVDATYKFVVTITTGATGSYDSASSPVLYGTVMSGRRNYDVSGATMLSQHGTVEVEQGNAYTFTYDGIPYEKVVGKTAIYIRTSLSNWESALSTDIHIVNSYFGLESYYDEDLYKSDVLNNLNNINNSLGDINNSIGDTNDKLDDTNDKLDGVQDSLDNLIDDEINKSEEVGNDTNAEAEEALGDLPDFSESYNNILNNLSSVLYDMNTQTSLDLPDGNVNIMGVNIDIWGGAKEVDFSTFLEDDNMHTIILIGKGFSVLGCMATSVYWAFKIKEWITSNDEVSTPEIPFLPGGGKY